MSHVKQKKKNVSAPKCDALITYLGCAGKYMMVRNNFVTSKQLILTIFNNTYEL